MFGWNKNNSYSTVSVNGKTIHVKGNNIAIINDKIIVDGKVLDESMNYKNITVIVEGDCNKLDAAGEVTVRGNCGSVDCGGSCTVNGDVNGNVDAGGSVTCGNVSGDIDAGGSVRCKR